jgi:hypothetical protein
MKVSICAALLLSTLLCSHPLSAEELVEKAGVGVGLTAGNMWFVPIKAISVSMGLGAALASFIFTAGDTEVAAQTLRDSAAGPYLITPEVAKTAIGERPELENK